MKFGYSDKVPEEIREMLTHLCGDIAYLTSAWQFYLRLFSDPDDSALLFQMVPESFRIIEEALRRDMTLAISRLDDPVKSAGKPNISLQTLVEQCNGITDLPLLLQQFHTACEPIRTYRSKLVAHNDRDTILDPHANPLQNIVRSQVEKIIQLAQNIANQVYGYYDGGELGFEPIVQGGADELLFWLKKAKNAPRQRPPAQ